MHTTTTIAARTLGMINRTITYKERGILVNLYKSLVRPHLEYCMSVWSPHYAKDKELLERCRGDLQECSQSSKDSLKITMRD